MAKLKKYSPYSGLFEKMFFMNIQNQNDDKKKEVEEEKSIPCRKSVEKILKEFNGLD